MVTYYKFRKIFVLLNSSLNKLVVIEKAFKISIFCAIYFNFENMFPIAGQTAGPIGLKFFGDTQRWPGGVIG